MKFINNKIYHTLDANENLVYDSKGSLYIHFAGVLYTSVKVYEDYSNSDSIKAVGINNGKNKLKFIYGGKDFSLHKTIFSGFFKPEDIENFSILSYNSIEIKTNRERYLFVKLGSLVYVYQGHISIVTNNNGDMYYFHSKEGIYLPYYEKVINRNYIIVSSNNYLVIKSDNGLSVIWLKKYGEVTNIEGPLSKEDFTRLLEEPSEIKINKV